ncbi:MAG: TetR family transcriptional regulator [Verrucomicrobia bacterium]|nr:TetR family transcriptional regulator [Verrucomicrobiota bacterium]
MKIPVKERILTTADELFTQRGYGNVGINEIIARSGAAKASFYHYFPSKDSLCLAWLNRWHEKTEAECEALLNSPGGGEKKILRFFEDLKPFLEGGGFRGCPFTNTAGFLGENNDPRIRDIILKHKDYQRQFLVDLARDFTTPARADKLGSALFLLYSGATTESQNQRSTWPVDRALPAVRKLIKADKPVPAGVG